MIEREGSMPDGARPRSGLDRAATRARSEHSDDAPKTGSFKADVLAKAPFDLESLGIDHPHRRWDAARAEIRRARAETTAQLERGFRRARLLIETWRAWETRGGSFAPSREDLQEARLCVSAQDRLSA